MEKEIKNRAEFYRILLMIDAISLKEVSNWADSIIIGEEEPNDEILDLSFSERLGRSEAARKLGQILGPIDNRIVTGEIKAFFRSRWLERKSTSEEICKKLYGASSEESLTEEFRNELTELNEVVRLVEDGLHYSRADVENLMWQTIKE